MHDEEGGPVHAIQGNRQPGPGDRPLARRLDCSRRGGGTARAGARYHAATESGLLRGRYEGVFKVIDSAEQDFCGVKFDLSRQRCNPLLIIRLR